MTLTYTDTLVFLSIWKMQLEKPSLIQLRFQTTNSVGKLDTHTLVIFSQTELIVLSSHIKTTYHNTPL